jgi:hypothetical protein
MECPVQRLGEAISWLVVGLNGMYRNAPTFHLVSEMMILDVDMLGSRANLRNFGKFYSPTVILENLAINLGNTNLQLDALRVHLFHDGHQRKN